MTAFYKSGGALFEADGVNHYRAVEPVMRRLGEPSGPLSAVPASMRRVRELGRRATRLADRFLEGAGQRGVWLSSPPSAVHEHFLIAARSLAYAEALLERSAPDAVVIAATANIPPRALVYAARAAGVASVYLPHAPVVRDPALCDLPTDLAGVRGPAEVAYYAAAGAETGDRVEAVGNPSIESDAMPEIDPTLGTALAPPIRADEIAAVFAIVEQAVGAGVTVCPHPRSDPDLLRSALPAGWRIWDGPSFELLRAGPAVLLHYSSGLALEAQLLGIPTIELRWPADMRAAYPAIENELAHSVATTEELGHAIAAARALAGDEAQRSRVREIAKAWSDPVGEQAAERAAALVKRATGTAPRAPIWDAWGAG